MMSGFCLILTSFLFASSEMKFIGESIQTLFATLFAVGGVAIILRGLLSSK